ncbi:class I SAM-dependent methyltransferase [Methylobacterium sp. 285MFTsu5.1]|uniref:class I SAM-dependent methyltransferase n=1 Tax=Methylobacterium sp. 285MFTsu5.1 TaxID=1172187 RepID=UPI001319E69C|nr:class I SAM-dependent methyltransferase [Methylobacterium sp. 285MFTsu5.1]
MEKNLLENIYYGGELDKLEEGTKWLKHYLRRSEPLFDGEAPNVDLDATSAFVREFFSKYYDGAFGGPITPGDAAFIMIFMSAIKPSLMMEIGVASGISSAFILSCAEHLQLTSAGTFLNSFDISKSHQPGFDVGQVLRTQFRHLEPLWRLNTELTSLDILMDRVAYMQPTTGPSMAFIDGGHEHPWPFIDIFAMSKVLPHNSWILLQDTQIMERWIADCIIHGSPAPRPVRGVNIALSHWPGSKIVGLDICYNMAAIKLDVSAEAIATYCRAMLSYPYEDTDLANNNIAAELMSRFLD